MNQHPARSAVIHIGAHKTATTHLQRSFLVQQEALIGAGVRYYGPDSLRRPKRGLGDVFGLEGFGKTHPARSQAEQRDFMFKDGHRLVLSDENFIGVLHNKHGNMVAPLYPKAEPRVEALAEALDVGPLDVCIGVREPASFLVSAYGQALMGGQMISFADYIAKNPLSQVYWPGLVARIRRIPTVGRITVWRHEEYRWLFHAICGAMLGDDVSMRIVPIPNKVHLGLSAAAVAHVLTHMEAGDPNTLGDQARKAYPLNDQNPAFDPFTAQEREAAQADYAKQLADISSIAGVTVLRS